MLSFEEKSASLLKDAGIMINGENDWDLQVHNKPLFARTFKGGSLAFREAYMDGWWDVKHLDRFFEQIFRNHIDEKIKPSKILP